MSSPVEILADLVSYVDFNKKSFLGTSWSETAVSPSQIP